MGAKLTVGSLFSGIGGLDLGLERAGMKILWQCENDPFCQKVLRKHWPEVEIYDDVRKLDGRAVAPIDVLCGGFPCQDVSEAGLRRGMGSETRSGLWAEFARVIGEAKPRWVLVENVRGLLSIDSGRGVGKVFYDLSKMGYDAEGCIIPSSLFGAPHRRDRFFIVGNSQSHAWKGTLFPESQERNLLERYIRPGLPIDWNGVQYERGRKNIVQRFKEQISKPVLIGVDDGVPSWMDRNRTLGNAVVPQVAEHIGRLIVRADGGLA